jgi:hypothetical protein
MFQKFQNLETDIETITDLVVLLNEPDQEGSRFVNELSFSARGRMTVVIGESFRAPMKAFASEEGVDGKGEGEIEVLTWRVTKMEAFADSKLGEIKVTNLADRATFGTVRQVQADSPFPAILEAEVCAEVNVPGFGKLHTITPIPIRAEITSIPPFGVEAAHRGSGILADENSISRGMIVGKSITLVGPA